MARRNSAFVEVLFQQHFQFEKRLDAIFGRSAAPVRKRCCSSFDGGVHFGNVGDGNFSQRSLGGGIDEVLPIGSFGIDPLAAYEMGNADVRDSCCAHRKYLCDREEKKEKCEFVYFQ